MSVSKYKNRATEVDGIRFSSAKEARRYGELRLLERAGEISALVLQPRFPLVVNGHKICTYVADFSYLDKKSGRTIEDAKGFRTDVFKIKAKLMAALHQPVVEI